jgi:pimeloyl-ACP methyl ester carboxylesterase
VTKSKAPERQHSTKVLTVGGREICVAVWKAKAGMKAQRPLLFFNGIGANIEAMSPLADWFSDRDIVTYDMPGIGQ